MDDSARTRLLSYLAAGGVAVGLAYFAYSYTKKLVQVRRPVLPLAAAALAYLPML
jgi:hypothetical protein